MNVFIVTGLSDDAKTTLGAAINDTYKADATSPIPNVWFVSGPEATTKEVCDKLGASAGERGLLFITKCEAYFGFGPPDLWEWIKVKKAAEPT